MTARLSLATALLLVTPLAACEAPEAADVKNLAPVARMFFPQLVRVDEPASFDARRSSDEDGDALSFALNAGDGTPQASAPDGLFVHVYDEPGSYGVEIVVTDELGLDARAGGEVVVVGDDASCDCDLACFDEAVCTDAGCVDFSSSDDDDRQSAPGALSCP